MRSEKKSCVCMRAPLLPPPKKKKMFVKKNCWIFVSPSLCSLSFHFCRLGMDNWDGSKIVFISLYFYFFSWKRRRKCSKILLFHDLVSDVCVCRMKVLEKRKKKQNSARLWKKKSRENKNFCLSRKDSLSPLSSPLLKKFLEWKETSKNEKKKKSNS